MAWLWVKPSIKKAGIVQDHGATHGGISSLLLEKPMARNHPWVGCHNFNSGRLTKSQEPDVVKLFITIEAGGGLAPPRPLVRHRSFMNFRWEPGNLTWWNYTSSLEQPMAWCLRDAYITALMMTIGADGGLSPSWFSDPDMIIIGTARGLAPCGSWSNAVQSQRLTEIWDITA